MKLRTDAALTSALVLSCASSVTTRLSHSSDTLNGITSQYAPKIFPTPSAVAARTAGHASDRRRVSSCVCRDMSVSLPSSPSAGSLRGKASTSSRAALRRTCQLAACREAGGVTEQGERVVAK